MNVVLHEPPAVAEKSAATRGAGVKRRILMIVKALRVAAEFTYELLTGRF
jgi:hypothetical protein